MKKLFKILGISILSIIVLIFLSIGIYSKIGTSTIKTNINGMGTKLVAITFVSADRTERHLKFGFCINDKINMKVTVNNTCEVNIKAIEKRTTFRSKGIKCFIDPNSEVEIIGKSNEIAINYEINKGNNLSYQFAELRKELLPYYVEESKLWFSSKQLRNSNQEKSRHLTEQFDSLRFYTVAPLRTEWAKQHLDYELTPRYFLESHIPKDTVIYYHNLLSSNAQNSEYGKILSGLINGWERTKSGNLAPNFSQITDKGQNFNLNQLKGKYVVLDFWGSWCGPCMHGVPKMKEYYEKFKSEIEFVGIACNDKESDWKEAIEINQMNWIHVLNDKSKNDIATLYGISSYPTKIIVNQKGEIISKFNGERIDFYYKIDSMMIK